MALQGKSLETLPAKTNEKKIEKIKTSREETKAKIDAIEQKYGSKLENGAKQLSTVATLLYRFLSCWCLAKSIFLRSISLAYLLHFNV